MTRIVRLIWKYGTTGDKIAIALLPFAPPLILLDALYKSAKQPIWNGFWVFFPFFVVAICVGLYALVLAVVRECKRKESATESTDQ